MPTATPTLTEQMQTLQTAYTQATIAFLKTVAPARDKFVLALDSYQTVEREWLAHPEDPGLKAKAQTAFDGLTAERAALTKATAAAQGVRTKAETAALAGLG